MNILSKILHTHISRPSRCLHPIILNVFCKHADPHHPHLTRDSQHHQHFPHHPQPQLFVTYPYNADQLIRLKIFMRQTEHSPRKRRPRNVNVAEQSTENTVAANVSVNEGLGRNAEDTTQFSFCTSLPASCTNRCYNTAH